jgi:hypothetical protein
MVTTDEHRLEVTMPEGYPRDAPLFRMLPPVFHPTSRLHAHRVPRSRAELLDELARASSAVIDAEGRPTTP